MKRKRYYVSGEITISVGVEVEADNPEEAVETAAGLPVASLCDQCQRGESGEWVPGGGLDGEPENIKAEEL